MASDRPVEFEVQKKLSQLWKEVHQLSQERLLLRERLKTLESRLKAAQAENELLRKVLVGLRKHYLRSFLALAVSVFVVISVFFAYMHLRVRDIETQVTAKVARAFSEEALVGTVLKENYPELYRVILKNTQKR